MTQTGVLLHVYHLKARGWEQMVWGNPAKDRLGTLPKLVELLLTESVNEPITTILLYSGPSRKDNLSEGEYTKQYLLQHFSDLKSFPTLQKLLDRLTPKGLDELKSRLENIVLGPEIKNTYAEVVHASQDFKKLGVTKIIQLCVASHAPRCMQKQMFARDDGFIRHDQVWSIVMSDTYFDGTVAADVVIFEPPHRGDDPMTKLDQTPPEVMKEYFNLDSFKKQHFIAIVKKMLKDYDDQRL